MTFKAKFTEMMNDAHATLIEKDVKNVSRLLDVHPSQLPICPTSYILGFNKDLVATFPCVAQMIVDEGSAIHEVIQDHLGINKRAFGNWVCPECGQFFQLQRGQRKCPNCDKWLKYQEVPVNYKGFAGHVDFICNMGTLKKPQYWLVDFKTTSMFSMESKVKTTPMSYDLQTKAYCLLLRLQYGIHIKGRAICYINRDNPAVFKIGGIELITKQTLKDISSLLKSQRELLDFLLDCTSYKEFMQGIGIQRCSNPYCKYCSKYDDTELKYLLKTKFKYLENKSVRFYINGKAKL